MPVVNEDGDRIVVCDFCGKRSKPLRWSAGDDIVKLIEEVGCTCPDCQKRPMYELMKMEELL